MKFSEYEYERPNMGNLKTQFKKLVSDFNNAESYEKQNSLIIEINKLRSKFESMERVVYIRHNANVFDLKYEKEQNFFDENKPEYESMISKYYKALIDSKYKEELKERWGKQLFNIAELKNKIFSPEIIDDLKLENKLISDYTKLLSSAKIEIDGEFRNLPQLRALEMSMNRETREKASKAKYEFFKSNESKFDENYDKLVKVRTKIARKLGYENFTQIGYMRMLRSDYTPEMVAKFREQVLEDIVPLATTLRNKQKDRLGLQKLKYYDEGLSFKDGNAKVKGDVDTIIKNGKKMYRELSQETQTFFEYMLENELMNLVSKEGKSPAEFCTYISELKSPFIVSNFNGTLDDIDVLTHEAGHAFQMYSSREYDVLEYNFPTLDACEIHSMSMEFFTWPWMELFFGEDADKYRFSHMSEALLFMPYGVTVDEFQHFVYENPDATIQERKVKWREIEKKYLPHRDYDGNEYLEYGGYWHQQGHIFKNPFYYIDYTLAEICAFQFWKKYRENPKKTWENYFKLCKAGGSKSFVELVKLANLKSPFEEGCVKSVISEIENYLMEVTII